MKKLFSPMSMLHYSNTPFAKDSTDRQIHGVLMEV
jgi:hypothetical protein